MRESNFVTHKLTFAALFLIAACVTQKTSNITEPEIDVAQVVGPAELNYPVGPIEVQYDFRIANQWTKPMTVTRIEMSTVNSAAAAGAYALRHDFYNVNQHIAPGDSREGTFWAHAYSFGHRMREGEPVTVRAIVHFDTSDGPYQKVLIRNIPQPS